MKYSLRSKILGSFALIVILALAAAVGAGAKLTRSRYDDFAYQQDLGRAESLSAVLGTWTAEAGKSETPPPLPPSVALFFLPFQEKSSPFPPSGMMMSRRIDRGMTMEHLELNRIVITDLSGRVLLDTSGYDRERLEQKNLERTVIRNGEKEVGYLYVGRMIPDFHLPAEVPFLRTARMMTWLITAVIFIFAMILGLILTKHITGPVKILNEATRRVEGGDLSTRVPDTRSDELGDLSRGFNSMTEFLDSADRQRRRLIADSAHELRTPVSLIRTRIEMMEEGIYPMDAESLAALSAESERLTRLVDELKTLSDLESPEMKLNRELTDLEGLILETVEACRPEIFRREIDVRIATDGLPEVSGDKGTLQRLISNLLSNALRYADSRILISADTVERTPGWLEIRVEDDGPGIPEGDRANIFQRYYRVDASRNRSSGGSGLGLAICSEIVRAHGGRISAGVSGTLGGAELKVMLPIGI